MNSDQKQQFIMTSTNGTMRTTGRNDNNEVVHVHSHMPPEFNPQQSSAVEIEIAQSQTFIFKN